MDPAETTLEIVAMSTISDYNILNMYNIYGEFETN
jgi:hypothetical protein